MIFMVFMEYQEFLRDFKGFKGSGFWGLKEISRDFKEIYENLCNFMGL